MEKNLALPEWSWETTRGEYDETMHGMRKGTRRKKILRRLLSDSEIKEKESKCEKELCSKEEAYLSCL